MKRSTLNLCHYCDNPSAFGLLESQRVTFSCHQFNPATKLSEDGCAVTIGWETVDKTKLLHPPAIPVTGFQGVECKHGEDK